MSQMLGTFGEVFLVLGILMAAAGAVFRAYWREKEPYKGRATATVVEVVPGEPDTLGRASGIHDYFYPVFAYYANGHLVKAKHRKGSNPPSFSTGQKVELKYDLNDPSHFELYKPERHDQIGRLLYIGGMCAIVGGCVCYLLFGLRVLG